MREKAYSIAVVAGRFGMLLALLGKISGFLVNVFYLFFRLFPREDKIVILSRQSDIPSEDIELLSAELEKSTKVLVLCKMVPEGIWKKTGYAFFSIRQIKEIAVSRAVVTDGHCPVIGFIKNKKTPVIQIWHAAGAVKKFGYCAIGKADGYSEGTARSLKMYKNFDVIFVGSEACKEQMAPAFGCDKSKCVVAPLPRMDKILYGSEDSRKRIYEAYPALKGEKVILYAPTFRKHADINAYFKNMADAAQEQGFLLLIKAHENTDTSDMPENALLAKGFSCTELLSVACAMVTDYSSVVFESALAGVPIYLYRPDLAEYEKSQGLFDIDIPAFSSDDAGNIVSAAADGNYDAAALKAFAEKYVDVSENNTKRMADMIISRA